MGSCRAGVYSASADQMLLVFAMKIIQNVSLTMAETSHWLFTFLMGRILQGVRDHFVENASQIYAVSLLLRTNGPVM